LQFRLLDSRESSVVIPWRLKQNVTTAKATCSLFRALLDHGHSLPELLSKTQVQIHPFTGSRGHALVQC
jgi:hypothetical protein